ncbi:MAG: hypothetical protein ACM3SQ_09645 [Betaproteobacteria bacterium]
MADFNVRSDSVDVEQIMEQIRARIREKRGVDYTEEQLRELAAVKLEKFLDPRSVRSDLLQQYRRAQAVPPAPVPLYAFEDTTLFESHRGIVRFFRTLFAPILKLLFNPTILSHVLHAQADINRQYLERFQELRQQGELHYELLHNLVVEITRLGIEAKNLKMRIESLQSRLEFNERRARALESVVVYKPAEERGPEAAPEIPAAAPQGQPQGQPAAAPFPAEGPGQRSRRRRRRRGRRGGGSAAVVIGTGGPAGQTPAAAPGREPAGEAGQGGDEEAAREAGELHAATAETVEQALASDTQHTETHPDSTPEPGGPGPDDQ